MPQPRRDLRRVRFAVKRCPLALWQREDDLSSPAFEMVEATWAQFVDAVDGEPRWVLRTADAADKWGRVSGVLLRGATCETGCGRLIREHKTSVCLLALWRFHTLDVDRQNPH